MKNIPHIILTVATISAIGWVFADCMKKPDMFPLFLVFGLVVAGMVVACAPLPSIQKPNKSTEHEHLNPTMSMEEKK